MNNISNIPANIMFQDYNPRISNIRKQMIKNIVKTTECEITKLEDLFFSDENIDIINKQLILSVWKKSNKQYKINFQEKNKLIIVMRYIFIEYAKHLPYNIQEQINELNCIVVGDIVPTIITNFEQKLGYLRDIEKRGDPPPLPQSTSINKTLVSNTNF